MHSPSRADPPTMRMPLFAAGAAVAVAIAVTAGVRLSGVSINEPDAPVFMKRTLQFADRSDGGIDVTDTQSHRLVETVTGQSGFIRGTLRGLARERRREGIGPSVPFELIAHTDGRLTLLDPSTARRVDLESFGPTNLAEFVRLLRDEPQSLSQRN